MKRGRDNCEEAVIREEAGQKNDRSSAGGGGGGAGQEDYRLDAEVTAREIYDRYVRAEKTPRTLTTKTPIFAFVIDWTIDATGKLKIFEIQQFSTSVPSIAGKRSERREYKEQLKLINMLGIKPSESEYQILAFGKVSQRHLLTSCGLQEYQPKYVSFCNLKLCNKEQEKSTYSAIRELLKDSDKNHFVIKSDRASRGEGNRFYTRKDLEEALATSKLDDLLPESDIQNTYNIEEVIATTGTTLRSSVKYNPQTGEYKAVTHMKYIHAHGSSDSHSYIDNGGAEDLVGGYYYNFKDKKVVAMSDLEERTSYEETNEDLRKVITIIAQKPDRIISAGSIAENFAFEQNKEKEYLPPLQSQYIESALGLISSLKSISSDVDKIEIIDPSLKDSPEAIGAFRVKVMDQQHSLTLKTEELRKRAATSHDHKFTKEDRAELKLLALQVVKENLRAFKLPKFAERLDNVAVTKDRNAYYLKKMLAKIILGDFDKESASPTEYRAYKRNMDKFMAMPLDPELLESYLKSEPSTTPSHTVADAPAITHNEVSVP